MGTFIAGAVLIGIVTAIIVKMTKDKKKGKKSCCGCGHCKSGSYKQIAKTQISAD